MPGDPKECHMHAVRCAELAVQAKNAQLRATFLGLSKHWEKLALELEWTYALLGESAPRDGQNHIPPEAQNGRGQNHAPLLLHRPFQRS